VINTVLGAIGEGALRLSNRERWKIHLETAYRSAWTWGTD